MSDTANPEEGQGMSVEQLADALTFLDDKPAGPQVESSEEADTDEPEAETEGEPEPEPEGEEPEGEEGDEAPSLPEIDEKAKLFRVKIAGVESEVSLEELRNGYQRNADYVKHITEAKQAQEQAATQRQHYSQALENFIPILKKQLDDKYADINWEQLAVDDPTQYVALDAQYKRHKETLALAEAEQAQLRAQAQAEAQHKHQEDLKEGRKQLLQWHPEFADPKKGKQIKEGVASELISRGYAFEEIRNVSDPRAISLAYDAYRFRQAQKAKTAKVVEKAPKVQKPGTSGKGDPKANAARAAADRLKKSGKVEDLADYLGAIGVGNS